MNTARTVCLALSLLPAGAVAQTLSIAPLSLGQGQDGKIEVSFQASPGKAAATLQFEIEVPAETLIPDMLPQAGAAAAQAGKSATCVGMWIKTPSLYAFRCVLSGGKENLPDGVVVVLPVKVPPGTKAGSRTLKIRRAQAATLNAARLSLRDVSSTLNITP